LSFFLTRHGQLEEVLASGDPDIARVLAARVQDDAPGAAAFLEQAIASGIRPPEGITDREDLERDPDLAESWERWHTAVAILLRWHGIWLNNPGTDLDELVEVVEDMDNQEGADLLRLLLWGRCWGSEVGGAMALSPFGSAPAIGYLLDGEISEALTVLGELGEDQSKWAVESARALSHLLLDVLHAERDLFCVLDSPFPDPL